MSSPQLYKATGIILKRMNIGEGDRIVSVFCRHFGKKRFIGKGIRKITSRRAAHLELFSCTEFIVYRGKAFDSIVQATSRVSYGTSYVRLNQMAVAYAACEIVDRLIMEGQESDEAYELLDCFLGAIGNLDRLALLEKITGFINSLLCMLGYIPKNRKDMPLQEAISLVESIIERKIRSAMLLAKSGILV